MLLKDYVPIGFIEGESQSSQISLPRGWSLWLWKPATGAEANRLHWTWPEKRLSIEHPDMDDMDDMGLTCLTLEYFRYLLRVDVCSCWVYMMDPENNQLLSENESSNLTFLWQCLCAFQVASGPQLCLDEAWQPGCFLWWLCFPHMGWGFPWSWGYPQMDAL
jgi:hypothetical protein